MPPRIWTDRPEGWVEGDPIPEGATPLDAERLNALEADLAEALAGSGASNLDPLPNGIAAPGTSAEVSRADHVHPETGGGLLLPAGKYTPLKTLANDGTIPTASREYCMGFLLAPQTIDRIAFLLITAGEAGSVLRIGIRADDDGLPGAPVIDVAVATNAGAPGFKSAVMDHDHPGGTLWVTWTAQFAVTGPAVDSSAANGVQYSTFFGPMIVPAAHRDILDFATGSQSIVGYQDGVAGALPATFINEAVSGQRLLSLFGRRA